MSWRSGGVLFAEIWPAIVKHIPDRDLRIAFITELLRLFVSRGMDPWPREDVHPDEKADGPRHRAKHEAQGGEA